MGSSVNVFWFRRDLRLRDNAGLFHALKQGKPVVPIFIFDRNILDEFGLAANNVGWQWAAGTGSDAAPYFRIFNPYLQTKKFDPELKYIRKWVPESEELTYAKPIVDHEFARKRCLETYGKALA